MLYYDNKEIAKELEVALKEGDIIDRYSYFQETFSGQRYSSIYSIVLFLMSFALCFGLCIFPIELQVGKFIGIVLLIVNGTIQSILSVANLRAKEYYSKGQKKPWWITKAEFIRNGHIPRKPLISLGLLSVALHLIIISRILFV